jgi:hypothetical protein
MRAISVTDWIPSLLQQINPILPQLRWRQISLIHRDLQVGGYAESSWASSSDVLHLMGRIHGQ